MDADKSDQEKCERSKAHQCLPRISDLDSMHKFRLPTIIYLSNYATNDNEK